MSKPSAASPRANSTTPRLSLTLTSALGIAPLLHVDARHAPPDRGQHLVGDRLAPGGQLVGAEPSPNRATRSAPPTAAPPVQFALVWSVAAAARHRAAPPGPRHLRAAGRGR